jgi:hypothetical protein
VVRWTSEARNDPSGILSGDIDPVYGGVQMPKRILFARVGWMPLYRGKEAEDLKPVGGGSYNATNRGLECFNFLPVEGRVFGYFQPQLQPKERLAMNPSSIHLEKIDAGITGNVLTDVLVIFVARNPDKGGQYVVGWYPNATVHRYEQESSAKAREGVGYYLENDSSTAVLIPHLERDFPINQGKGGFGQANICYRYDEKGNLKDAAWMDTAVEYALTYDRDNVVKNPACENDTRIANILNAQIESGAGFQSNPLIRKRIEEYSMEWARQRLQKMGLDPVDKHKTKPYDFLCKHLGSDLFVEVKGTQTDGTSVFLTPGEVRHAKANPNTALFVVFGVTVRGSRNPKISGGEERLVMPLDLNVGKLEPHGFTYALHLGATKESFQSLPMPNQKEELRLHRSFNDMEMEQIKRGFIPQQMEDKWFIYFDPEVGDLLIHRSWTGYCVYKVNIQRGKSSWQAKESWVNREPSQYEASDTAHDRDVASWVIDTFLLRKDRPFPEA